MKGWHFLSADGLGYEDGRKPKDSETITVEGELELCRFGLHASARILDAVEYAPVQSQICRVALSGDILRAEDKACSTERTILWRLSVEETESVLRDFARRCALDVIYLWDAPAAVVEYLKTGDESKRAAARDAAWDAAWAAARAAARDAAWDADWDAARDAARDAAWAAAWAAAWDRQNRRLTSMAVARRRS